MKEYAVTLSWVNQSHWTVRLRESIKNTDSKNMKVPIFFSHDTGKEKQGYQSASEKGIREMFYNRILDSDKAFN